MTESVAPAALVTVTVNVPEPEVDAWRALARNRGISMTDALRRALVLTKFIEEIEARGDKLLVEDKDRKLQQLFLR